MNEKYRLLLQLYLYLRKKEILQLTYISMSGTGKIVGFVGMELNESFQSSATNAAAPVSQKIGCGEYYD